MALSGGYRPPLLSQPASSLARVNERHWLAADLLFVHSGHQAFWRGQPIAPQSAESIAAYGLGGTQWPIGEQARGFKPDGTNSVRYAVGENLALPLTLSGWWHGTSGASSNAIVSVRRATDAGGVSLRRDPSEQASAISTTTAAATSTSVSTAAYVASRWMHGVAVFAGAASRTAYGDGGTPVNNTASRAFPTDCSVIGIGVDAAAAGGVAASTLISAIALPMVISRVLDAEEVERLHDEQRSNPWGLFQERRIWVPVASAATLAISASPVSVSGTLSTTGDLTITPAATLALSASPLAIAGTLATAGELDYLLPTLALSASPLSISGTLAPTGDLAYELPTLALSASPLAIAGTLAPTGNLSYTLPTLALSASPLALSGTLTPSGEIGYTLPFTLTASALAVSGTLSVSCDLSITDQIKLTLSASPLALAGALAVAGDLDYVVPTLVLSASPLALSGALTVTGDPAAVVPFVLSASPITLTGAVDVTGEIGAGTRFNLAADPIIVTGALGVSGEIVSSFTVPQPLSAAPTGRRVQTSGGRMNVQTTRRPTFRGGTR